MLTVILMCISIIVPSSEQFSISAKGIALPSVKLEINDRTYTTWDIDGAFSDRVGAPKLPVERFLVLLPEDGYTFEIEYEDTANIKISYPVLPKSPPWRKGTPKPLPQPHPEYYNGPYPKEPVHIMPIGRMRGQYIVLVEIYPYRYNPDTSLTMYRGLRVKFSLRTIPYQPQRLQSEVLSLTPQNTKAIPSPTSYLIVTPSAYTDELADFVSWKNEQGFIAKVATEDSITDWTADGIRNYIVDAYNSWSPPPTYVLLVGDVEQVPTFPGSTSVPATDLYYACVDGDDFLPDLLIGRLPCAADSEVITITEKLLLYEKGEFPITEWVKKAVFMASSDNYKVPEGTHNYVIENYLTPLGFTSDKLYTYTYEATTEDVSNAINNGRGLAVFSGHGSETYWADGPAFYQSDVQALTNTNMYPVVCSHACLTGSYHTTECFGETWLRVQDKGAVVFWGASTYTYWDEDDILEKAMFAAFTDSGQTIIGEMTNTAKYYVLLYYPSSARYYYEEYNILGDPSLDVWQDTPQILMVDAPRAIPEGGYTLTIGVKDSLTSLGIEGAIITTVDTTLYTDIAGTAELYINALSGDTVRLTITKDGYRPKTLLIPVVPGGITATGYTPKTLFSDGDTVSILIQLANLSSVDADTGTILVRTQDAVLLDSTSQYPQIPAGDTVFTEDSITLILPSPLSSHTSIPLEVFAGTDTSFLILPVYTPVCEISSLILLPHPYLVPPESLTLTVSIVNPGTLPVESLTVGINTGILSCSPTSILLDTLSPGDTATFLYEITAPDTLPHTDTVICSVTWSRDASTSDTLTIASGMRDFLVWNPCPDPSSGSALLRALNSLNLTGDYSEDVFLGGYISTLPLYRAIFVCAGNYPNTSKLSAGSPPVESIVNYVEQGGNLYIEGGDVWCYDIPQGGYNWEGLSGITGISDDASSTLDTLRGLSGSFMGGVNLVYTGSNLYVDSINISESAFRALEDKHTATLCVAGIDTGTYRMAGATILFGGVEDSLQQNIYADRLYRFLTTGFVGIKLSRSNTPKLPTIKLLSRNPNPEGILAKIYLPRGSTIQLDIYDVSGRCIYKFKRNVPAGIYTLKWYDPNVSSGVYFYTIQTQAINQKGKIIILR